MSKVTSQLDSIIRNAGWAKAFADYDNLTKFKKISGVEWVTNDILNDADNESRLLWMIKGGGCFPKIGGDEPVRPDVTPNTPEQEEIESYIKEQVLSGQTSINIDGVANNIIIPAEATKAVTITGEFQDGFTITNLSGKQVTINNTGDAASVIIDSDNASTLVLKGNYKDVWANVRTVNASAATMDSITFDSALEGKGKLSVNAAWNNPVSVTSYNTNLLTINNSTDEEVLEGLTVLAPNATVELLGKWGEVTITVANDTLYLNKNFHAHILNVISGNTFVYNCFPEQAADVINIGTGYTFGAYTMNVPAEGTSMNSNPGIYNITEDCTASLQYGMFASGNFKYVNSAHVSKSVNSALILIKSNLNAYFEGNGTWENPNGYCVWKAHNDGELKIYGGHFIGDTHSVYAEKGFIDIYGGEFEVVSENKKYVLNVLDSAYTAGTAGIHVYGGKFHDFDPANSESEPGAPVSFVAEGYKSVQTAENIWEVFPEDAEVEEWKPVAAETPSPMVEEGDNNEPIVGSGESVNDVATDL